MHDPERRALIELLLSEEADAGTDQHPVRTQHLTVLVVAALLADRSDDLLADALRLATSTPDRQFVAIAAAHLAGDHDAVDALARDHLLDHPPRPVLAWIVHQSRSAPPNRERPTDPDPVAARRQDDPRAPGVPHGSPTSTQPRSKP